MNISVCSSGALLALAVMSGAPATLFADEPRPAGPQLAPEVRQLLDRVREHYDKLTNVSLTVGMSYKMPDQEADGEQVVKLVMGRPNRFSFRMGEDESYAVVSDGRELTQFVGDPYNKFSRDPSPPSFTGLVEATSFGQPIEGLMWVSSPHLMAIALFDKGEFARFFSGLNSVVIAGRDVVDGVPLDKLTVKGEGFGASLWVRAHGEPWVVRIVPDFSGMFAELGEMADEMRRNMPEMSISLRDWNAAPLLDDSTFAFKLPEGAEQVPSLIDAIAGMDDADAAGPESRLIGKPAPEARLGLLDGGAFDLASHRDRNIVILDFWATWCPPCVRGLPVVSRVAAEFKDKGVVFFAINLEEDAETIRAFLKRRDLNIPVALDTDGLVGEAFHVSGIPMTVIIGRDGTIQAVHTGFHDAMEARLRDELAALVEGRPLPAPPIP